MPASSSNIKTILVTGAARGIGYELVKQYAAVEPKATTTIIATVRDVTRAPQIDALIKAGHDNIKLVQLDAGDDASIAAAVPAIAALSDHVDLLVNNAGIQSKGPAHIGEAKRENILEVYSVNVVGPLAVFQALLPLLKAAKTTPVVVNVTSTMGSNKLETGALGWGPSAIAYASSKATLNFINSSLATAYKDITFLGIHPGWVQSTFLIIITIAYLFILFYLLQLTWARSTASHPPPSPTAPRASAMSSPAARTRTAASTFPLTTPSCPFDRSFSDLLIYVVPLYL